MRLIDDVKNWVDGVLKTSRSKRIPVIGIDLSNHYVRMSQLIPQGDQWVLNKFGSMQIDKRVTQEDALEMETLRAIEKIYREARFTTTKVAVSIPITSAIVKVVNIPILKDSELKQAVENGSLWETAIHLPAELSEYSIFWQIVKKDEAKNEMSILFVASRLGQINRVVETLSKAGLEALVIDVRCFALRNILKTRSQESKTGVSVLLEISGEESYIVFVDGDLPFIYDIFISDTDMALLHQGSLEADAPTFERIAIQIRNSIQYFIAQSGKSTFEMIEFVSALEQDDLILSEISKHLSEYRITKINPLNHIIIPENLKARLEKESNKSALTSCIGMATRQVDVTGYYKFVTAVSNINLLPDREGKIEEEKQKNTQINNFKKIGFLGIVLGVLMLITSGFLNMVTGISAHTDELTAKINTNQAELKNLEDNLTYLNTFIKQRAAKNDRLLSLNILSKLPKSTLIKEIKMNADGASLITLISNDPLQFSVFVEELAKDPDVKNVKLDSVEMEIARQGQVKLQTAKVSFMIK